MAYPHLHVHSHYTLLGATAGVADLAQRAAAEGMSHLALTDTMAMYGQVAFARACAAVGVQSVVGMMIRLSLPGAWRPPRLATSVGEMVLLARDQEGYASLARLSTYVQGSADREGRYAQGIPWAVLAEHIRGLLAIEGGRRGWAAKMLAVGAQKEAARYVGRLAGLFDEAVFLGVERHDSTVPALTQGLVHLSQRFGVPLLAVQPVYCLEREERKRLRLLAAIRENSTLAALDPACLPNDGDEHIDLHWLPPEEMRRRFADLPQALENIELVVQQCGPAIPTGHPIWPAISLEPGISAEVALAAEARAGMARRYGRTADKVVSERLTKELAVIGRHGYAPLFLLVADIVRFARAQDIPVSTRGSVANSLVAYCVGITTVDPIAHDLLFERFLSPARLDPPDIDLDFCSRRRDEVLAYLRERYGAERMALVSAHSTFRPKSAVREVGKAYGLDEAEIRFLAQRFPRRWHPDPRRRSTKSLEDVLAEIEDGRLREVMVEADGLLRQPHHITVHAGGVVVAPQPLTDIVPLQWTPKGFAVTQYDHHDVEAIGLPKIDLLGVRALTVLADTVALVRRDHDPNFRLDEIPLADAATARTLSAGETIGVFQSESVGARRTLRQLKATSVADLAVANAFFKPGPATGGMARTFVRRYRGEERVRYLHPALEPILARTKGVLIFQEQILRVATEIAGLSWEQADHIRRGMSKFRPQEMAAMQEVFVAGCRRAPPEGPGLSLGQAQLLWEQVRAFAGYGFNQGHATAYADVSYRSAYLKTHYPAAFFCARLAGHGGFHHPAIYMAEARRLGAVVRGPHVNHSERRFSLSWEPDSGQGTIPTLWMGLGQVRDLREHSVRRIVRERQRRPFSDLRDLLARVPLRRKEVLHLIQCGALEGLGRARGAQLAEMEAVDWAGDARQLAFDFVTDSGESVSLRQCLQWEVEILGLPMSAHPLALLDAEIGDCAPLSLLPEKRGQRVCTAAVRLPGWSGGKGYYVGDEKTFVLAREEGRQAPRPWQPLRLWGRWQEDEWGMGWFVVEEREECIGEIA